MVVFGPPWNEPFVYKTIGSVKKILTRSDRVTSIAKPLCIVGLILYNLPLGFWDVHLGFLTCLSQMLVSLNYVSLTTPLSRLHREIRWRKCCSSWPSPFSGIFSLFLMPTTILEDVPDMGLDRASSIDRSLESFGCCKTVISDWPHSHRLCCVGGFPQTPHPRCSLGVAGVLPFQLLPSLL